MTEYDMTWVCPECKAQAVVDYEALLGSGQPMCSDCDMEMERKA